MSQRTRSVLYILGLFVFAVVTVSVMIIITHTDSKQEDYLRFKVRNVTLEVGGEVHLNDLLETNLSIVEISFQITNENVINISGNKFKAQSAGESDILISTGVAGKLIESGSINLKVTGQANEAQPDFEVIVNYNNMRTYIEQCNEIDLYLLGGNIGDKSDAIALGYTSYFEIEVNDTNNYTIASNKENVLISEGTITAKSAGSSTLTITDLNGGKIKTQKVNVHTILPTSVKYEQVYNETVTLFVGDTLNLPEAVFSPSFVSDMYRAPVIDISNTGVLGFDINKFIATKEGSAQVTLMYGATELAVVKIINVNVLSTAVNDTYEFEIQTFSGQGYFGFCVLLYKNGVHINASYTLAFIIQEAEYSYSQASALGYDFDIEKDVFAGVTTYTFTMHNMFAPLDIQVYVNGLELSERVTF